jgi:hypothetical protein
MLLWRGKRVTEVRIRCRRYGLTILASAAFVPLLSCAGEMTPPKPVLRENERDADVAEQQASGFEDLADILSARLIRVRAARGAISGDTLAMVRDRERFLSYARQYRAESSARRSGRLNDGFQGECSGVSTPITVHGVTQPSLASGSFTIVTETPAYPFERSTYHSGSGFVAAAGDPNGVTRWRGSWSRPGLLRACVGSGFVQVVPIVGVTPGPETLGASGSTTHLRQRLVTKTRYRSHRRAKTPMTLVPIRTVAELPAVGIREASTCSRTAAVWYVWAFSAPSMEFVSCCRSSGVA